MQEPPQANAGAVQLATQLQLPSRQSQSGVVLVQAVLQSPQC
jgi:hypothetical protein